MVSLQALNKLLKQSNIDFLEDNDLDVSYFTDYENEYNFILEHYKKYKSMPDRETILDKFPKFQILDVKEPDDFLINKLREQYVYNKSVPVINKAIEMYGIDSYGAVDYLMNNLKDIQPKPLTKGVDIIKTSIERYNQYLDRSENTSSWYFSSGFKELDILTNGLQRGEELVAIFARINQGKSWCSLKIATSVWEQGFNVGYYSPEMSTTNIAYRFDSLHKHFSNRRIRSGDKSINKEYKKYVDDLSTNNNSFIVATTEMFDNSPTVSKMRKWALANNLDLLVIDGISFMQDERKSNRDNQTTKIQHIAEDLMTLSIELKIPVIAVIQANRGAINDLDEAPDLEHIRDSDGLAQAASLAISVRNKNNTLELNIKKNRNGPVGNKLLYAWDIDIGDYKYIPNPKAGLPEEVSNEIEQQQRAVYENDEGLVF